LLYIEPINCSLWESLLYKILVSQPEVVVVHEEWEPGGAGGREAAWWKRRSFSRRQRWICTRWIQWWLKVDLVEVGAGGVDEEEDVADSKQGPSMKVCFFIYTTSALSTRVT
jgi:hypothetical protein